MPKAAGVPSIVDVAHRAGVSRQTVSRVLNNHHSVRPETRQRVLDCIEELGYRRNLAAHALASKRSSVLGVVVSNAHLLGPSASLLGIDHAARKAGYWVSVTFLPETTESEMDSALQHFQDQAAEGAVVITPNEQTLAAVEKNIGRLPMVLATSADTSGLGVHAFDIDQRDGAHKAMEHLLGLGHERIGHLTGPLAEFHSRERLAAWREDLQAAGHPADLWEQGDWSPDCGYAFGKRIAADRQGATALFVANDQMASGVLRALNEEGIRVPEDMSVVGFDDMLGAGQFIPPLTTLKQDFEQLGRTLVDLLVGLTKGEERVAQPVIPELIVRQSTGPAPRV
jgi:DNA-binding LacI/PurR family transcriptional regulator